MSALRPPSNLTFHLSPGWHTLRILWEEFWGYATWGDPTQNQARLVQLLALFDDWCVARALPYWIDFGVLLGAQRHGTLIPWDHDLDVGMLSADFRLLVDECERLKSAGELEFEWACSGTYRVNYRDVWVDVFEWEQRGDWLAPTISQADREGDPTYADHPVQDVLPIGTLPVSGRWFPTPARPDACLRRYYGDYARLPFIPMLFYGLFHPIRAGKLFFTQQVKT